MKHATVETAHDDGRGNADDGDRRPKSDAEPADQAVQMNLAGTDKRRLQEQEDQLKREDGGVEIKKKRAGNSRMDQVLVDREAEAVHDDRDDQQRHREIEVAMKQSRALYAQD